MDKLKVSCPFCGLDLGEHASADPVQHKRDINCPMGGYIFNAYAWSIRPKGVGND